jgi:hypothetical protein
MDFRTFESLHQELERVGSPSLFAYLDISPTASIQETEAGLDSRRAWAQGQQANPKYRSEAVWFIQNYSRVREILLRMRADYIRFIESRMRSNGLDQLEMFIKGTLVHGALTPLAELAAFQQAERLGIPEDVAASSLDRILTEEGLQRAGDLPDHYVTLGVHPQLPQEHLETFYARRRKWVNNTVDPEKFRRLSTELEAAWWVLGNVERRRQYDHQYRRIFPEPPPLSELAPITPESDEEEVTENGTPATAEQIAGDVRLNLLVPKLLVDAPDVIQLKPNRQPISMTIAVRNIGRGEMAGTIGVDQPWAQVSPAVLDPRLPEQTITITVDPMAMPQDRGEVRVTISTRRCGSRTLIIDTRRKVYVKQLMTAGAVLSVAALIGFPLLAGLQRLAESTQTHLVVRADPPTGDVSINDRVMGLGGVIDAHEHFPINEPFTVRIDADGYQPWEQQVTVPEGELVVLTPQLELSDTLIFHPGSSESRNDLDIAEVTEAIAPVRKGVDGCITSTTAIRGYVSPLGVLIGLEITSGDSASRDCLMRQLRAVSFPMNTTSSYSAFEYEL